jgi:predicted component of type VI protein secretion system
MIDLLFERLAGPSSQSARERITRSLDQVLVVQSTCTREAPPGVLNFGLPRPPDVQPGQRAGDDYAALVRERIEVFEPRLKDVGVQYVAGEIRITAELAQGQRVELARSLTRGER